MGDLAELAASAIGFAAREHLTIVPVPQHDYGPEVCLGPGEVDLPGFLELAGRPRGGVLYGVQVRNMSPGPNERDRAGQTGKSPITSS